MALVSIKNSHTIPVIPIPTAQTSTMKKASSAISIQLTWVEEAVNKEMQGVNKRVMYWTNTDAEGNFKWGRLVTNPAKAFTVIGTGLAGYNEGSAVNMALNAQEKLAKTKAGIHWLKGFATSKGFSSLTEMEGYFIKEESRLLSEARLFPRGSKKQMENTAKLKALYDAKTRFSWLMDNCPHIKLMYIMEKYKDSGNIPKEVMADLYAEMGDSMIENLGDYSSAKEFYTQAILLKPELKARYEAIFKGNPLENMGRSVRDNQEKLVGGLELTANIGIFTELLTHLALTTGCSSMLRLFPWIKGY